MSEPITTYQIGSIVYLVTDPEQLPRMITGYMVRPNHIVYYLTHGVNETLHYSIEFTTSRNQLTYLGVNNG